MMEVYVGGALRAAIAHRPEKIPRDGGWSATIRM